MEPHKENKVPACRSKNFLIGICVFIGCGLAIGAVAAMIYGTLRSFIDMEHYMQVWQNPITVTAVVTDHRSYDDDDDTDYQSFVTYDYKNVRYDNLPYEDRDRKESLTPLGTEVTIQISPKDPEQQISKLKESGAASPFIILVVFGGLAAVYAQAQKRGLSKRDCSVPDKETIRNDLQIKVRSRWTRPFLMICCVGYALLYCRCFVVLGQLPLVFAGICGAGWLYCMYTTIRDYHRAENEVFELRRDVLVDKHEVSDSDGTSYTLYYKSGERTWKTYADEEKYRQAAVGDVVLAVYLPGKKRPILHYNLTGSG